MEAQAHALLQEAAWGSEPHMEAPNLPSTHSKWLSRRRRRIPAEAAWWGWPGAGLSLTGA